MQNSLLLINSWHYTLASPAFVSGGAVWCDNQWWICLTSTYHVAHDYKNSQVLIALSIGLFQLRFLSCICDLWTECLMFRVKYADRSWRGPRDNVCPTRIVSVPDSDCHIVLFGFHSKKKQCFEAKCMWITQCIVCNMCIAKTNYN